MTKLTIRLAEERDQQNWDAYVLAHREGTIFHTIAWRSAILSAFGHPSPYYLAEDGEQNIKGILPIIQLKSRLFGNILSSVPFASYGGPLADDDQVFTLLMDLAKQVAAEYSCDYLELKFQYPKPTGLPGTNLYWAFIKELSADHETNMKAIPRKQRAMVRKGINSGLRARYTPDFLPQFYDIFAENVQRMGTPVYPITWFASLLQTFGDAAELMVIEHQGRIISGVLSFYYKDTVLPYYAASSMKERVHAPNDFQYWELMRHAVDRGCAFFDYGRSKTDTGPFHFKKHWGFTPIPLHYQYLLHNLEKKPEINPTNPKYRLKIEAWKRLPGSLARWLGPNIVKYIP